jgi:AraC-like DNA-binding protein
MLKDVVYQERLSPRTGAVLWTSMADGTPCRVLPDGCMDLIWLEGRLLVAGPDTRAHLVPREPGTRYAGLRFPPGHGPALLGVPAHELRDSRVPLDALWPGGHVRRLTERICEAMDPSAALEAVGAQRLREVETPDPLLTAVAAALRAGKPVSAVAQASGLGERQLHRRCLAGFGYGPKTLARVLRMDRALALARRGIPLAEVAAVSGYADQAHLSREVKSLTGVVPSKLLR